MGYFLGALRERSVLMMKAVAEQDLFRLEAFEFVQVLLSLRSEESAAPLPLTFLGCF